MNPASKATSNEIDPLEVIESGGGAENIAIMKKNPRIQRRRAFEIQVTAIPRENPMCASTRGR